MFRLRAFKAQGRASVFFAASLQSQALALCARAPQIPRQTHCRRGHERLGHFLERSHLRLCEKVLKLHNERLLVKDGDVVLCRERLRVHKRCRRKEGSDA